MENPEYKIFFFDESRFGTHSRLGHGWFKTGVRTTVEKKVGFKNFYIYTALEYKTGKEFSVFASHVDTSCMNIFLAEFAEWLKNDNAFIIMDQAGWHKSKDLKVPQNIRIIYLPPYSPELNPVERFWQYIKDNVLKNKIFEDLQSLQDALSVFIDLIDPSTTLSICNTSYLSRYF